MQKAFGGRRDSIVHISTAAATAVTPAPTREPRHSIRRTGRGRSGAPRLLVAEPKGMDVTCARAATRILGSSSNAVPALIWAMPVEGERPRCRRSRRRPKQVSLLPTPPLSPPPPLEQTTRAAAFEFGPAAPPAATAFTASVVTRFSRGRRALLLLLLDLGRLAPDLPARASYRAIAAAARPWLVERRPFWML